MNDVRAMTAGARFGSGLTEAASMTDELVSVGMESEGEITGGAESLPTTPFTEGEWGGTTAIMKDESLVVLCEILSNIFKELIRKVATF